MTDTDNPRPVSTDWQDEQEHEVAATPTPYDRRYESLGDGGYRKRAAPHDE